MMVAQEILDTMASEKLPLRIREAVPSEDYSYIYSSFLNTYCGPFIRHHGGTEVVEPRAFFTGFHQVLERLLAKRRVLIACPEEHPSVICGWCIGDTLSDNLVILDFLLVRQDYRGMGIARELYQAMGGGKEAKVAFTLFHPKARSLLEGRCETYQYVPFFILGDWSNK